jgi:diguanylate cyclase (GGDEF)-like protein
MARDELENWFQELRQATEKCTNSVRELHDRVADIAPVFQAGNLLQAATTPEEAYAEITRLAGSLFPGDAGTLYLRGTSPAAGGMEAVASWPAADGQQGGLVGDDCWALRTGRVHLVDADSPGPYCKHVAAASCSSSLCVPMTAHGESLGLLHFRTGPPGRNRSKGKTRLREKQWLAIIAAGQVAPVVANLRLRELLTDQATRDPLTGLFNRRLLKETLGREVQRARPGQKRRGDQRGSEVKPVGVVMLDVDGFKQINQELGHPGGDEVLRRLGILLQESCCRRAADVAFRYAGDEFTVILPDTSLKNCRRLAQKFRNQVSLQIRLEDRPRRRVTVSLGVAAFPDHGSTPEALIRAADTALFRAKQKGHNRVEVAKLPDRRRGR